MDCVSTALKSFRQLLISFSQALFTLGQSPCTIDLNYTNINLDINILNLTCLYLDRFITRPRLDSVPLKASSNFLSHFHKLLVKVPAQMIKINKIKIY